MKKFEVFEIVNEDEEVSFDHEKGDYKDDEKNCQKEVIILGGKLLCSDVYSLMERATSEELKHVEIHTVMDSFTDATKDSKRGLFGKKLTKSPLFGHEQKQRKKRESFEQKRPSFGHRSGSTVINGELYELTVLTEDLDPLDESDHLKTKFPPILQAKDTKSLLKRKQEAQKPQTTTNEFLPSLNVKANLNEKINVKRSQTDHLPILICKQGLMTKTPPPSPESASESLPPTPSPKNTVTTFTDASPIIPQKKAPKSYGLNVPEEPPPSPRRPTLFPSIWGEDRFFMISIGSNVVVNEKAKAYIVKEESDFEKMQ